MATPTSFTTEQTIATVAAAAAANGGNDFKALVCIFLFGGNDCANTVMPLTGTNRSTYDANRAGILSGGALVAGTSIGIPASTAPTNLLTSDWRLHPHLVGLKSRWDEGNLSVIMNVGTLREPMNRTTYYSTPARRPLQVFSHNSQVQTWQCLPGVSGNPVNGWMGRSMELIGAAFNPTSIGTGVFSIQGPASQVQGYDLRSADMQAGGPTVIDTFSGTVASTVNSLRGTNAYANAIQQHFASRHVNSITTQQLISSNLQVLPTEINTLFTVVSPNQIPSPATSPSYLTLQLKVIARTIASRTQFQQRRQMFFIGLGGFDTHDNLLAQHGALMSNLDTSMNAFWQAMVAMGMENNVTVFTESDFGRALVQNGSGSDHGWGAHHFIQGGAVNAGSAQSALYGSEPDLRPGSSIDVNSGRLIPTTSTDQYMATLLNWWGVPRTLLPLVVENLVVGKFNPDILPMF